MTSLSQFTVLIERRALVRLLLTASASVAVLAASLAPNLAHANQGQRLVRGQIAKDLAAGIDGVGKAQGRWVRQVGGERQVQVVVVSDSRDATLAHLSAQVQRLGGQILVRHGVIRALTVQMPARSVRALARHPDVVSISPNRETARTASTLEAISGALTSTVRSYGSTTSYSGLDGSGVGIAVLDSGVMKQHASFQNAVAATRVMRNVNMLNGSLANWTATGGAESLVPGSTAYNSYVATIANDANLLQDGYGHGTHVAAVAAGRGFYQAPDSTGIAPNASIYDVKVLNDQGYGNVSDALEGIQWVIYHAKAHNIRVMNLSLAASSTESWQTDPLCIAVRSAAAAGITVVVAGGNFGRSIVGKEVYGTIGAPGNDPTVITVGAVNFKSTTSRSDDVVANFSSRGPTRGAWWTPAACAASTTCSSPTWWHPATASLPPAPPVPTH
jgi:serine protease AprX